MGKKCKNFVMYLIILQAVLKLVNLIELVELNLATLKQFELKVINN